MTVVKNSSPPLRNAAKYARCSVRSTGISNIPCPEPSVQEVTSNHPCDTNSDTTHTVPTHPILIIGAGLSGLALAHALKTNNIPFQIFERDSSPSFRAQGYRIRIQDFYLKQLLPPSLWDTFINCCGEVVPGICTIDASTGETVKPEVQGGSGGWSTPSRSKPAMVEGTTINVDRMVLRELMMEPMINDGSVQFGKKFERYEIVDGGVVAYFADGCRITGRLVVGADGARSLVRKQLVPHYMVLDTGGRAIFGKTVIEGDLLEKIPHGIGNGLVIISGARVKGSVAKIFCDTTGFKDRCKTDVELPQDYVYLVFVLTSSQSGMTDREFMSLSREDSVKKSLELTQNWHESCQELVRRQLPEATSTLAFSTALPDLTEWETSQNVTLMGDAAHPMTPVRGVGANSAFQDATLLLRAILNGASLEDIASYEDEMRKNSQRYVTSSIVGASNLFEMRPVEELKPWPNGH